MNSNAVWIWYPDDFEIYHGMLQNFQREERGMGWPAYWKMDDWRKNVTFRKEYRLTHPETFTVHATGTGYVAVDECKYPYETEITVSEGTHLIEVVVGNMSALPSAFVEGGSIVSDASWTADDHEKVLPVGTSDLYTDLKHDPTRVWYEEEAVRPVSVKQTDGGTLFDFGRMVNGTLNISFPENISEDGIMLCYGESRREALDAKMCYYSQKHVLPGSAIRRRAFRFLFVPEVQDPGLSITAVHQYIPIPVRSEFHTNDTRLQMIWDTAVETYRLCSGLFFIDGIKRDRWIWSGDAYQNYFVNPYVFFDKEINHRTIVALRGNPGITQHINTILDYSLLWILSIEKDYETFGDEKFVRDIYPKMEDLMRLCDSQLDENGFIVGRERDWTYIDWADIDKTGAVGAEQMLLAACCEAMADCGRIAGREVSGYEQRARQLKEKIRKYYWDAEKGAYIDSFASGRRHVSRQTNIFAILYGIADEEQTEKIVRNVIFNDAVAPITTPYFEFFELDLLGRLGYRKEVLDKILDYWGGMTDRGAVTFWEAFDPTQTEEEQYAMYGDPYGKSLCHGWAASPVYLICRYFIGLTPTSPGYRTYSVDPHTEEFPEFTAKLPCGEGYVEITKKDGKVCVTRNH